MNRPNVLENDCTLSESLRGSGTFQRKQQRAQRDTGVEDVLVNEE